MSLHRLRSASSLFLVAAFAISYSACSDDGAPPADPGADAGTDAGALEDVPENDSGAPPTDAAPDADASRDADAAPVCGDGKIEGDEECEDGASTDGDGCDSACHLEPGWQCTTIGQPCTPTKCGDGLVQGTEQCDNGKNDWSSGCTPTCTLLPSCTDGVCTPICGDGIVSAGEACDDGNNRPFDGCSATCTVEPGFTCTLIEDAPPPKLTLPVVHRDFRGYDLPAGGGLPRGHIDFQNRNAGHETGIVATTLDANGKLVYAKSGGSSANTNSKEAFDNWFANTPPHNLPIDGTIELSFNGASSNYTFGSEAYFPIDAAGFVARGEEPLRPDEEDTPRNFSFTTEMRTWFEYAGTEVISAGGDDDIWLFVNGRLAIDLGGVHGPQNQSVTLAQRADALGLTVGGRYEIAIFRAERHTSGSSFQISLRPPPRSHCVK